MRESESKLVKTLFIFEFFQGSAIALFFTAAISIFLNHLPTTDIPKVYVLSALFLWGTGLLYHKLEHTLSLKRLITVVIVFNTVVMILFRVLYPYNNDLWYMYLFLATFNVLYLLNNLEFWGLAAQVFDLRQSKRLFGIISAGDIPAKMIGFLSAYLVIPYIGTENLLVIAAALSSISFLFLKALFRLSKIDNISHHGKKHHATQSFKNIHVALSGNKLIRRIAAVSFFSFAIFLIVNFIFYGYVKQEFQTDKDLVSFFAVFFAITRLITLALKIGISNKMVDRLGLGNALMVSPLILLLICGSGIFFIQQFDVHKYTFYLFGILTVIADVLRSAIQTPVLLAIMQPLPLQQRLKGHTIIKGLMDPFAFLTAGIFLWFYTSSSVPDFGFLNYVLIVLILCWAYFTRSVEHDYLQTLHTAIRNRNLDERDVAITDKDSLDYLLNKLANETEMEAISVLKLVSASSVDKTKFLEAGMHHPSANVQLYTLSLIQNNAWVNFIPLLKHCISTSENTAVLPELITTLSALDKDFDTSDFISHPDPDVAYAATLSTIPNLENKEKAAELLFNQFHSKNSLYTINALKVAAKLKLKMFDFKVIELMNSEKAIVKTAARKASAALGTKEIILKLMDDFVHTKNDLDILEALENIGLDSIEYIRPFLIDNNCQGTKSRKLINVLGKINVPESRVLLEEILSKFPENADAMINSLYQLKGMGHESKDKILHAIKHNLDIAIQILFKIRNAEHLNPVIADALELELKTIRSKCVYWFSILYNANTISKAKMGFYLNTKETIANALELIQMTVKKDFASLFTLIFENSSTLDKCLQLEMTHRYNNLSEAILAKNILFDVNYSYSNWTKACVLYGMKDRKQFFTREIIMPFTQSQNEVLKNTAEYILLQEH